jgi:hypothetical protein
MAANLAQILPLDGAAYVSAVKKLEIAFAESQNMFLLPIAC